MSRTLADIAREYIDAAEDAGWVPMAVDLKGEITLEDASHHITIVLKGIFVTPDFIRTLPDGGMPKPVRDAS